MKQGTTVVAGTVAHPKEQSGQDKTLSLRDNYLKQGGFKRDPFRTPVAEQEYGFYDHQGNPLTADDKSANAPQSIFTPRSYYVDPLYKTRREGSVFDQLRAPGHLFVYGLPGTGKSTLRFALEAYLRGRPDGATLAVTYELEEDLRDYREEGIKTGAWSKYTPHPDHDVHMRLLARALSIDLFIQIVEQFSFRDDDDPPTDDQNNRLVDLLLSLDTARLREVKKAIRRLMDHDRPDPSPVWGSAEVWQRLDRTVVVAVSRSPRLTDWLAKVNPEGHAAPVHNLAGKDLLRQAMETARLWGFRRVYALVDGVDALQPRPEYMRARLDPLLRRLPLLGRWGISLKFFLPAELSGEINTRLSKYGVAAADWRKIELKWTTDRLQALITNRYRAGGTPRTGLSDLVVPALRNQFDSRLIDEAQGSPRRLVTLVDELIEAHVEGGRIEDPITNGEWRKAVIATNKRLAITGSAGNHTIPNGQAEISAYHTAAARAGARRLYSRAWKSLQEKSAWGAALARDLNPRRRTG